MGRGNGRRRPQISTTTITWSPTHRAHPVASLLMPTAKIIIVDLFTYSRLGTRHFRLRASSNVVSQKYSVEKEKRGDDEPAEIHRGQYRSSRYYEIQSRKTGQYQCNRFRCDWIRYLEGGRMHIHIHSFPLDTRVRNRLPRSISQVPRATRSYYNTRSISRFGRIFTTHPVIKFWMG
jgi:hypothetical protein